MGLEVIGAIGLGLTAVGTAAGIVGQVQSMKAGKKAERLRERQMNLDAARERRAIVRQATLARATAVSSATEQGAQFGSGLAGGLAQVTNQANQSVLGTNQNQEIGAGIFAANRQYANGQMISGLGQGLQGFGGMFLNNAELFSRLGTYYGGRTA